MKRLILCLALSLSFGVHATEAGKKAKEAVSEFKKEVRPEKTGDPFLDDVLEDTYQFSTDSAEEVLDTLEKPDAETPPSTPPPKTQKK